MASPRRSIAALFTAELVSTTGTQMTWLAIPWFVLTTTGSPSRLSFVLAAERISAVVAGMPSGGVVARFGARRVMLVSDSVQAVVIVSLPLLCLAGALDYALILSLTVLMGAFINPCFSSQRLILPDILGEDEKKVASTTALLQGATRRTALAGPAVAGTLIALLGAPDILFTDAGTHVVAFFLVLTVVRTPFAHGRRAEQGEGVLAGSTYALHDRRLLASLSSISLLEAAFQALLISLPVVAYSEYGGSASLAGWLLAAWAGTP